MWLSDYKKAIEEIEKIFGNCFLSQIQCSFNGERIIFTIRILDNLERYVYYRRTGKLVKHFSDTWRNPDHIEIVYAGDE